ncbi:ATP-binding protein [Cytophagaceae bacterium ABcell3]|nr:ATP-binding protein [Cytophagaceae bacterium ABcell3]
MEKQLQNTLLNLIEKNSSLPVLATDLLLNVKEVNQFTHQLSQELKPGDNLLERLPALKGVISHTTLLNLKPGASTQTAVSIPYWGNGTLLVSSEANTKNKFYFVFISNDIESSIEGKKCFLNNFTATHDLTGKVLELSGIPDKVGLQFSEYILNDLFKHLHPDDREYFFTHALQPVLVNKQPVTTRVRLKKPFGDYLWMEVSINSSQENKNQIRSYWKPIDSYTESDEKSQPENLPCNVPAMVFRSLFDKCRTMIYLSEGCHALTGYPPSAVAYNNKVCFTDLIHVSDKKETVEAVTKAINCKSSYEVEYKATTADGILKWFWEQGKPVFNKGGELIFIEGLITDITERKIYEEKLRENEKILKQTNSELNTFIYKASHDLKGPLASIEGLTMIGKDEVQDQTSLKYLDMINQRCMKLSDTVHLLINVAKIRQSLPIKESIKLNAFIHEAWLEALRSVPEAEDIQFSCSVQNINTFNTDKTFLHIIFSNLLENAVRYRRKLARPSKVSVVVKKYGNGIKVHVEDNGTGIKEKQKKRIFNMFFRGTELSQGSGLGLYLVKYTINKLGGRIHCTSKHGYGTRFTFVLNDKGQE